MLRPRCGLRNPARRRRVTDAQDAFGLERAHGWIARESYWGEGIRLETFRRAVENSLIVGVSDNTIWSGKARQRLVPAPDSSNVANMTLLSDQGPIAQTAAATGVCERTVKRRRHSARAWLLDDCNGRDGMEFA
jgi:hypothetical protein